MTPEFWAIIGVGAILGYLITVAASENEKRLDRILAELEFSNRDKQIGEDDFPTSM